jgi:hypothetical protein
MARETNKDQKMARRSAPIAQQIDDKFSTVASCSKKCVCQAEKPGWLKRYERGGLSHYDDND